MKIVGIVSKLSLLYLVSFWTDKLKTSDLQTKLQETKCLFCIVFRQMSFLNNRKDICIYNLPITHLVQ